MESGCARAVITVKAQVKYIMENCNFVHMYLLMNQCDVFVKCHEYIPSCRSNLFEVYRYSAFAIGHQVCLANLGKAYVQQ